jgi:glycine/D-amino acid oxidase-like deaminating enzyme
MSDAERILVVGAGVFGVTAALELRKRGHAVRLLDPGPLPHPLAASTDISKIVRLEYGADETYTALAEDALEGWRRWNRDLGDTLYHQTGLLLLRRTPISPGTLEEDSFEVLTRRGHRIERLDAAAVAARFPAWNAERFPYGIHDPQGGFVESGRAIARLVERAREAGVELREGVAFERLLHERVGAPADSPGRVAGIVSSTGERFEAALVVLAVGAWTPHALPWMAKELRSTGQPVFHLAPADPRPFLAERFPVFCADIQTTGYYGFPVHPVSGVVKIARHGPGRALHPESPRRAVTAEEIADLRAFLAATFPRLQQVAIPYTRVCLYCDSWDGHFWIAHDPDRPGLVLATGDSGHAFKFAPVLGPLVADVVEGRSHPLQPRFRWRPGLRPARSEEAARFQGA